MKNHLPMPAELQHLLEKRDSDERRELERRDDDVGPLGAIEASGKLDDIPPADRREGQNRRKKRNRRKRS